MEWVSWFIFGFGLCVPGAYWVICLLSIGSAEMNISSQLGVLVNTGNDRGAGINTPGWVLWIGRCWIWDKTTSSNASER